MIDDIKNYLNGNENVEGKITQSIIRIGQIFRGWIVQNQVNVQEYQPKRISIINKIIVKQSVLFYTKAQRYRNEVMHDLAKYSLFVIDWYKNVVESIEQDNKPEIHKYLQVQRLNIDQYDGAYIRQRVLSTMKMRKIAEVERVNNIRRFFVV